MIVYRIANVKYKDATLSGIGAEKVGGRWNEVGTRAVYCSENISLALLEYYVHSENIAYLPKDILVAKIQFPDEFVIEELKVLPEKWKQYPYASETTEVFTKLKRTIAPNFASIIYKQINGRVIIYVHVAGIIYCNFCIYQTHLPLPMNGHFYYP